jgi:hypothetical protein
VLLLQVPSKAQVSAVSEDLRRRSVVPPHIKSLLEALPVDTHPMTQLVTLVSAMQVGNTTLLCCCFTVRIGPALQSQAVGALKLIVLGKDALLLVAVVAGSQQDCSSRSGSCAS